MARETLDKGPFSPPSLLEDSYFRCQDLQMPGRAAARLMLSLGVGCVKSMFFLTACTDVTGA